MARGMAARGMARGRRGARGHARRETRDERTRSGRCFFFPQFHSRSLPGGLARPRHPTAERGHVRGKAGGGRVLFIATQPNPRHPAKQKKKRPTTTAGNRSANLAAAAGGWAGAAAACAW